jgi:hypothetical protein
MNFSQGKRLRSTEHGWNGRSRNLRWDDQIFQWKGATTRTTRNRSYCPWYTKHKLNSPSHANIAMCTTNLPVPFFSLTKQTRWWSRTKRSINQLNSCWPKRKRTQEKMVAETRKNNGWPVMRNKTKIFWYLGLKCVIKSRRNSMKDERRTYVLGANGGIHTRVWACSKFIQVQGVGHAMMHVYMTCSNAFKCKELDMHHACTWFAPKLFRDRRTMGYGEQRKAQGGGSPFHMGCAFMQTGQESSYQHRRSMITCATRWR